MKDKKKVLFVDDNKMDRVILAKILQQLDLDYVETASAEEFLPKIKEYQPDLCLVDLNISQNNDGRILIKAIRNILGAQLPIIIISAVEESKEIAMNILNGANDFVCKPIDKALLSSKIANFLHNESIDSRILPLFKLPKEQDASISMDLDLQMLGLSETHIKFKSSLILTPGSTIVVKNTFLKEVLPQEEELMVRIQNVEDGVFNGVIQELLPEHLSQLRATLRDLQKSS